MAGTLVTVATFTTLQEATLAKAALEVCGIPVFTADEFTIGINPLYTNALGGIKVQVPPLLLNEARAILADAQQLGNQIASDEAPVATNNKRKKHTWVKGFIWLWLALIATAIVISLFKTLT